jgi:MGT family glycosyltransferase
LAKRLHLPAIQYYHDFIYLSGSYCWTDGVGYNPSSMVEYYKLLDSFMWAYGFEQPNNFWYREELNLCPLPREFQFDSDFIDGDHFYFVGPLLDRPFTRIWKNRSGGKRIILVSTLTGSIDANYFNKVIDGLSNSEYHVILSVGRNFETGGLRPLPPNFEINTCASHLEILPYTDLHLYSGGISGTLEGFYFGVVLIAMPTFSYNYRIAERLAERGLTLNLPFHALTSQMIRDSVDAALRDHALLGRVRQMQTVVRSSGGAREAVDRIEKFLAEHT